MLHGQSRFDQGVSKQSIGCLLSIKTSLNLSSSRFYNNRFQSFFLWLNLDFNQFSIFFFDQLVTGGVRRRITIFLKQYFDSELVCQLDLVQRCTKIHKDMCRSSYFFQFLFCFVLFVFAYKQKNCIECGGPIHGCQISGFLIS